jgi:virulence-associated protein VapD
MAYGIAFDIDTNCYKDYIVKQNPKISDAEALKKAISRLTHLYKEIEDAMYSAGFIRLQGSVYRTEDKDDIDSIFDAVDELSQIDGLKECVKSVHAFRMEGWSDIKKRLK